jgi:hypothetical protein
MGKVSAMINQCRSFVRFLLFVNIIVVMQDDNQSSTCAVRILIHRVRKTEWRVLFFVTRTQTFVLRLYRYVHVPPCLTATPMIMKGQNRHQICQIYIRDYAPKKGKVSGHSEFGRTPYFCTGIYCSLRS